MSGHEKDNQSNLRRWIHVLFLEEDRVRFKEAIRLFKQTRSLNILFKELVTIVKTPEQLQILNVLREGFFSANPTLFDKICLKNFPNYHPSAVTDNSSVQLDPSDELQNKPPDKSREHEVSRESPFSTASQFSVASERPADENIRISVTAPNSKQRARTSESSTSRSTPDVLQLRSRSRAAREPDAAPLTEAPIAIKVQSLPTASASATPGRGLTEQRANDTSASSIEPSPVTSTPQSPEKAAAARAQKPLKPALHRSVAVSNGGQSTIHRTARLTSPTAENVQYAPMHARQESSAGAGKSTSSAERSDQSAQYSARKAPPQEPESGQKARSLTPRSQSSHSFSSSFDSTVYTSSITINLTRPVEISSDRTHFEAAGSAAANNNNNNSSLPPSTGIDELYARHKKQQEMMASMIADGDAKPKKAHAPVQKVEAKRLASGIRQRSFNTKNAAESIGTSLLPSASVFEYQQHQQQQLQHPLNRMFAPSLAQFPPPWGYAPEAFEDASVDFYGANPMPYFYRPPMPMGYMPPFAMHSSLHPQPQQQPPPPPPHNSRTGQAMYQRSRSQMVGMGARPMSPENSGPGTICGVYERVGSNFHWGLGLGAAGGGLSAGEGHGSRGIGGTLFEIRKVLMERQAGGRYGFTLRAGEGQPGGLFVAHVEPNETAFLCGLRESDRVLKINGLSAKAITLQQAIGMVQTSNALRLYVASVSTPATPAASLTDLSIASSLQEQDLDSDGAPLSPTNERPPMPLPPAAVIAIAAGPTGAHKSQQVYGTLTRGTRPQLRRAPADATLPRRPPDHQNSESQQAAQRPPAANHLNASRTGDSNSNTVGASSAAIFRSKQNPEAEPEPERDMREEPSPLYTQTSPDTELQVETLQRSLRLSPTEVTLVAHLDAMGSTKQLADAGVEEEVVQKRVEPVRSEAPAAAAAAASIPPPPVYTESAQPQQPQQQQQQQRPQKAERRKSVIQAVGDGQPAAAPPPDPDVALPKSSSDASSTESTQKKKKLVVTMRKTHKPPSPAAAPKPPEPTTTTTTTVTPAVAPSDNHRAPAAAPAAVPPVESVAPKSNEAIEKPAPRKPQPRPQPQPQPESEPEPQESAETHSPKKEKEPQKIRKMRKDIAVVADRGYFGFIIGSTPTLIVSGGLVRRLKTPAIAVLTVEPDSPAERAGLQVGDVIVEINEQPVAQQEQGAIAELMHRDTERVRLRLERYLLVT